MQAGDKTTFRVCISFSSGFRDRARVHPCAAATATEQCTKPIATTPIAFFKNAKNLIENEENNYINNEIELIWHRNWPLATDKRTHSPFLTDYVLPYCVLRQIENWYSCDAKVTATIVSPHFIWPIFIVEFIFFSAMHRSDGGNAWSRYACAQCA